MEAIKDQYRKEGKFTFEQMSEYFLRPSDDVLNMIVESDDFNFRKACLVALFDMNTNDIILTNKDFIRNPVINNTLKGMLLVNRND